MILDIIIVLIIVISTYIGYRKGLIGVGVKIVSFLIALVVTGILFYPISNIVIQNTNMDETIQNAIESKWITEENTNDEKPKEEEMKNPSKVVTKYMEEQMTEVKNVGVKSVANSLSTTIIRVGVAILLFILVRIVLFFFRKLAEAIAELPIIKQFNKSGGVLYGILKGLLLIYVVMGVLSLLEPMINNPFIFDSINKSYIGNFMYHYNILLMLIF